MAGRIFVTGDIHGDIDIGKLSSREFPAGRSLDKGDYVVICGDFGLVWGAEPREKYWLDWLSSKPWTTLFVDGNHENHDMLDAMPVGEWHGGKVHFVRDDVIHLMRGQVFDICGQRVFTMGGAQSHDIPYRRPYVSWWPRELPSHAEYEEALSNLEACDWEVDIVLTHCTPALLQRQLVERPDEDDLVRFLQQVAEDCEFNMWFFGHYHTDRVFPGGYCCLYDRIREVLGDEWSSMVLPPLYIRGDVVWVAMDGRTRVATVEHVNRAGDFTGEHSYTLRMREDGELHRCVPEGQIDGLVVPNDGDDLPEDGD